MATSFTDIVTSGIPNGTITVRENRAFDFLLYTAPEVSSGLGTISYSLLGSSYGSQYADGDLFSFDATSRQLRVKNALDHDTRPSHSLTIRITETTTGGQTRNYDHVVAVNLNDVADEAPTFINAGITSINALETFSKRDLLFEGRAIPDIEEAPVTHRITEGNEYVWIVPNTGDVKLIKDIPDGVSSFTFTIEATEQGGRSTTQTITANVIEPPKIVTSHLVVNVDDTTEMVLTSDYLRAVGNTGSETAPADLVYTVITPIISGVLQKDGITLGKGDTFTQQDVNDGLITVTTSYFGTPVLRELRLTISDGTYTSERAEPFAVEIRDNAIIENIDEGNVIDYSLKTKGFILDAGDGNDKITASRSDDYVKGGLGDDVIDLDGDGDSATTGGADMVFYNFAVGDVYRASDGGDTINNFKRGEDTFVMRAPTSLVELQSMDGFLRSLSGQEGVTHDDQVAVTINWVSDDYTSPNPTYYVQGIYMFFQEVGIHSGGRLGGGMITINFDERVLWDEFRELVQITDENGITDDNIDYGRAMIKDLSVLPKVFGEGSLKFEALSTGASLALTSVSQQITEGDDLSTQRHLADVMLYDAEGYTVLSQTSDSRFEVINGQLFIKGGSDFGLGGPGGNAPQSLSVDVVVTAVKQGHINLQAQYQLSVRLDGSSVVLGAEPAVAISPPEFINGDIIINVAESALTPETIFTAEAQYQGEGELTYDIVGGNHGLLFTIDDGAVRLAEGKSLDSEVNEVHTLVIRATAEDGTSNRQEYTVNVIDDDDILLPLEVRDNSLAGRYRTFNGDNDRNFLDALDETGATRYNFIARGGNDFVIGSNNADLIRGGDGDDFVLANGGNDVIIGGAGDDHLRGQDGADIFLGGTGNDLLVGGGDGTDIFVYGFDGGNTTWTTESGLDDIDYFEIGVDMIYLVDESGGIASLRQGLEAGHDAGFRLTFIYDADEDTFGGLKIRFADDTSDPGNVVERGIDIDFFGSGVETFAITFEAVTGDYELNLENIADNQIVDVELLAYELGNIGLRFEEFAEIGLLAQEF